MASVNRIAQFGADVDAVNTTVKVQSVPIDVQRGASQGACPRYPNLCFIPDRVK